MDFIPVIGLMSGTSVDGIDASLIFTNGYEVKRTRFNKTYPYSEKTKSRIINALNSPEKFHKNINELSNLSISITLDHLRVINLIINESKIKPILIGFHGQTIFHKPKEKISVQLGNGNLLSKLTKVKVVYDFRSSDLENGGEGAPIASVYHKQIMETKKLNLPSTIINIGGISNITYWDGDKLLGFDTGPGNNLMDLKMSQTFNQEYDNLGQNASLGNINQNLLNEYFKDEFYHKIPPKSLERSDLVQNSIIKKIFKLDKYDSLATLCAITATAIKKSYKFFPQKPHASIIVGGGQRNKFLVHLIKKFKNSEYILTGDEINIPSDFIEAELIAFLAVRKIKNIPSTFPSTTGVKNDTVLGKIAEF